MRTVKGALERNPRYQWTKESATSPDHKVTTRKKLKIKQHNTKSLNCKKFPEKIAQLEIGTKPTKTTIYKINTVEETEKTIQLYNKAITEKTTTPKNKNKKRTNTPLWSGTLGTPRKEDTTGEGGTTNAAQIRRAEVDGWEQEGERICSATFKLTGRREYQVLKQGVKTRDLWASVAKPIPQVVSQCPVLNRDRLKAVQNVSRKTTMAPNMAGKNENLVLSYGNKIVTQVKNRNKIDK